MTKSSISFIILLFISVLAYNQEIIDKVIAVVGEKPIYILRFKVKSCNLHNKEWKYLHLQIAIYLKN